jgi:hypothetical protein
MLPCGFNPSAGISCSVPQSVIRRARQDRTKGRPVMLSTRVDPDGSVHCPECNATSFTPQRSTGSKIAFGFASLLAAPKLRCNGCGTMLNPKDEPETAGARIDRERYQAAREAKAARDEAKRARKAAR